MIYYISMLSTTGGKLKVSPKIILKNYNKIKKINQKKNVVIGFGITNKNIQRDSEGSIDKTQNAYLRGNQSGRESYMTRSGRINYSQNSNRRSESLNRSFSSMVNAINNAYSNNNQRSL